jgi:hypothetical protein
MPERTEITIEKIEAIVDQWHFERFHGSLVARDTQVWNLVHSAKEDLKGQLIAALVPDAGHA